MFRIAVIPKSAAVPQTIGVLRTHLGLTISDLRARLAEGKPVAEFELVDVDDIRRCRKLLQDLGGVGATVRVFENVDGFGEKEESLDYLRDVMRRNIDIARQIRAEDELRFGDSG